MKALRWAVLASLAGCIDWHAAHEAGCRDAGYCTIDAGAGGGGGGGNGGGGGATGGGGTSGGSELDAGLLDGGADAGLDAGFDAGVCVGGCVADGGEPSHTVPACIAGACGLACEPLWGDCDDGGFAPTGNGCEYDLSSELNNCGGCAHSCGNAHASPTCSSGRCVLNCASGWSNCDGRDDNGCETSLTTDRDNCGACGFSCGDAGAPCIAPGVCRLTNGGESSQAETGFNALVADRTALYWVNTNPRRVRRIEKNGANLQSLNDGGAPLNNLRSSSIAVDQDYVYVMNDQASAYRLPKSGLQNATALPATNLFPGATSLYADGAGVARSRWLVYTQAGNNQGVYRIDLDAGFASRVSNTGDALGGVLANGRFYYRASTGLGFDPYGIHEADYSGTTPTDVELLPLAMMPAGGMAHDGTFLYVFKSDDRITRVSSGGASSGAGVCTGAGWNLTRLATDGTWLYIGGSGLHRLQLDGGATTPCQLLVPGLQVQGVVVDSDALYVGTSTDVYRIHK